ncbi:MAG: TraA family conjugative transfer protein [Salinisphaeraceae bacterium]|uniref:TraA family conjugative transfer protein n=1 Tax=Spectribacter acetivorans TaxID=3075603 RepID=A0ABU3B7X5_9GAMM|nr:TraA family conjugative transfer protein [Salinisphaera sp. P385]MDT0618577.1 TraA family conjugative transfer protein [Salinisphaera sp. P385]
MQRIFKFALVFVAMFGAGAAYAGAGGTEFDTIYQQLTDWTEGTLGRIIALGMIITGLGWGVVRQSIMAVVVGVAGGLALANAPTVIDNILGGVLF